jgi:hypothetical protein
VPREGELERFVSNIDSTEMEARLLHHSRYVQIARSSDERRRVGDERAIGLSNIPVIPLSKLSIFMEFIYSDDDSLTLDYFPEPVVFPQPVIDIGLHSFRQYGTQEDRMR